MYADAKVRRSTMMGMPCLRYDGRFLAMVDHRTRQLLDEAKQFAGQE